MNEIDIHNLAKWAKDYLAMQTSFEELVRRASIGDSIAKAALSILADSKGFTDAGYYTISLNRAKKSIQKGIEPPYRITHQSSEEIDGEPHFIEVVYEIDKDFQKTIISRTEKKFSTIEEEFLF